MDSPNKFDWEKPGTTEAQIQERRHGALEARHRQIMDAVGRWNDKARLAGCENIDHALDTLCAMRRGPRSEPAAPASGTAEELCPTCGAYKRGCDHPANRYPEGVKRDT